MRATALPPDPAGPTPPQLPLGGLRPRLVRLEVRRLVRNRRTLIFTMVVPAMFFLIFGLDSRYALGRDGAGNVSASILISMALYGAVLATTSGGAMVSVERAAGWSRQLRITPLRPAAYVATKMASSMVLGAVSVAVVYLVAAATRTPSMPAWVWAVTAGAVWAGSLLFAAFGLFIGYLFPSENVMQVIGFVLMLFSFGGGLFIPLSQFSPGLRTLARFTPLYGLNQLVHYPLTQSGFSWEWVANLIVWLAVFTAGAILRLRRDTGRV
ncbi:MAG TPA: ABC transporter permease [Acidimicrobiales bacterium]|nr:ABC transporter permease [Acidimicrobiales bacterium]